MANKTIFDWDYKYNSDDYFKDLQSEYSKNELLEMFSVDNVNDISDENISNSFYDQLNENYQCDSDLFDVLLDNNIIAFGDVGTWRGSFLGYRELSNNLNEILNSLNCDYYCVYRDRFNIRHEGCHHDGSNFILLRKWRKNITDPQKDKFKEHIRNKTLTNRIINYYTESLLPYVTKIIG